MPDVLQQAITVIREIFTEEGATSSALRGQNNRGRCTLSSSTTTIPGMPCYRNDVCCQHVCLLNDLTLICSVHVGAMGEADKGTCTRITKGTFMAGSIMQTNRSVNGSIKVQSIKLMGKAIGAKTVPVAGAMRMTMQDITHSSGSIAISSLGINTLAIINMRMRMALGGPNHNTFTSMIKGSLQLIGVLRNTNMSVGGGKVVGEIEVPGGVGGGAMVEVDTPHKL